MHTGSRRKEYKEKYKENKETRRTRTAKDKGEGLDYNTMTPEEIASITGAKGDKGDKGR